MSVSGEISEIKDCVILPIELEDDSIVNIKFLVLNDCVVYIIMGIDAFEEINALVSKKDLMEKFDEYDSENSSTLSDSENDKEFTSEDEDSIHLMYAGIEAYISDFGCPEINSGSDEDKVNEDIFIGGDLSLLE
ncbi:hypothetical protein AYI68_g8257 [Smittium mucronatum]|uniref:Uncharacterized protein n=1 Tax=Smittium mucronatum TaxID=133383 RepID=A0A1R0GLD9_9FUNG|nr:hypothetical protein AYI68_g8257 [Smittium mucronatum]